jgi:hypothetical protein
MVRVAFIPRRMAKHIIFKDDVDIDLEKINAIEKLPFLRQNE